MMFAAIVSAALTAVVLSELFGRGTVVYTRLATLTLAYVVCCVAATYWLAHGGLPEFAAILLSGVPMMGAWLGFRIHVSNSITLEMAELMADGTPRTADELAAEYGAERHTATRMAILREAGYLRPGVEGGLADTAKTRAIVRLMRILCGSSGPQSVAATLREQRPSQ